MCSSDLDLMSGLFTEHRLYLHPTEKEAHPMINELVPECFSFMRDKWEQKGIPLPYQTYGRVPPDTKNKNTYRKADTEPGLLETRYPDDPVGRLKLDDLGLSFDEVLEGAYLDLTKDSRKADVSPDKIISRKYGRYTEFLWKENTDKSNF